MYGKKMYGKGPTLFTLVSSDDEGKMYGKGPTLFTLVSSDDEGKMYGKGPTLFIYPVRRREDVR